MSILESIGGLGFAILGAALTAGLCCIGSAKGTGMVTCNNGQKQAVSISAKGGGLTVGKSKITDGFGEFANVYKISDVMGSYATGEAHAGAGASAKAQVMTNGKVSLALAGKGEGWDLGVAFGKFTLTPK